MTDRILCCADMDKAAKMLRHYASSYDRLHRDIADDLRAGALALDIVSAQYTTITLHDQEAEGTSK